MSYRRRHRWFRRMALGLAFASVMFAGQVSVAAAKSDEGTGGSRYVSAGGWSGLVDMESGIPLSAGIPEGDEQFIDAQAVQVIPYLSQGILTEADAQAAAAEAIHDPYLTDIYVKPGESLGGPDGLAKQQEWTVVPYLSQGILTEADAQTAAAARIHDRYLNVQRAPDGDAIAFRNAIETQGGFSGDELAFANSIVAAAESLHDPVTAEEQGSTQQQRTLTPYLSPGVLGEAVKTNVATETFVPGVTDFPTAAQSAPLNRVEHALAQGPQVIPYLSHGMAVDGEVGARPDNRADRFAHSDVASQQQLASSGSSFEWNDALTVGIGGLVLALGLGLALGYLRRPRLAGL
jgi:hypothetical protein